MNYLCLSVSDYFNVTFLLAVSEKINSSLFLFHPLLPILSFTTSFLAQRIRVLTCNRPYIPHKCLHLAKERVHFVVKRK